MRLNDILPIFNLISLFVFVALASFAGARMLWRFREFKLYRLAVPVLLKRDIAVFGSLTVYFGSALLALTAGLANLGKEWWWVMPRGIMVLSAMAYWVWIEYHLEDEPNRKGKEKK